VRHRPTAPVVRRRLGFAGLTGAVVFFSVSLTPSLLPRSWIMQGVIGGVSAAIGYALASLVAAGVRRLVAPRPGVPVRRVAWSVLIVGGTCLCAGTLWRSTLWQRDLRRLMGLDDTLGWLVPLIPVVAAGVMLAILLVARTLRLVVRRLTGALNPFVPLAGASLLSTAAAAFLVAVLVNDFLFRGFVGVVDASSSEADERTQRGIARPASPYLSGSPASLVPWRSLGRYGRGFVGSAVPRNELARFAAPAAGRGVQQPIRVYTGLQSAASYREQAGLAVRELVRTGAFRRRVLGIMATTGTGWVNGNATDALELMYAGDSALVAMQYSYLPSWVSFMVDRSKALRATRALVAAVRDHWARLPPRHRPRLVVFGESLGAFGVENTYGDLGGLTAMAQGALLIGPVGSNPIWREITARRDPGTPV
jgi:uncharacterized membrane protein